MLFTPSWAQKDIHVSTAITKNKNNQKIYKKRAQYPILDGNNKNTHGGCESQCTRETHTLTLTRPHTFLTLHAHSHSLALTYSSHFTRTRTRLRIARVNQASGCPSLTLPVVRLHLPSSSSNFPLLLFYFL